MTAVSFLFIILERKACLNYIISVALFRKIVIDKGNPEDIINLVSICFSIRTNIYINPPVAPPLGGYGYGYGYGGYGWSPFSFFAPGPSVAVGIGGGFDTLAFFLFLGAGAAVVRRLFRSRDDDDY